MQLWVVAGQHTHGEQAWLGRGQLPHFQATTTAGLTRSLLLLLSVCVSVLQAGRFAEAQSLSDKLEALDKRQAQLDLVSAAMHAQVGL